METIRLIVSILGFGVVITTLISGLRQYRRSEQWKRSEFVAKEMKEFESDPTVQNALQLVDWGTREINLFLKQNPTENDFITITREVQWKALLPHKIKPTYKGDFPGSNSGANFSPEEAKIRDTYDTFLRRFERFSSFIKSELVSPDEFKPYLIYWVDSIASSDNESDARKDAAWRLSLLTYINYYKYSGVQYLFNLYGKNIEPGMELYTATRTLLKETCLADERLKNLGDDLYNNSSCKTS